MSAIKIKGRSGCRIEFLDTYPAIIRKYSKSLDYNKRLLNQINKQNNFNIKFSSSDLRFFAPKINKIYNFEDKIELVHFDMEYINGLKFSDYFLDISVNQLLMTINQICEYIYELRRNCEVKNIDKSIFINKLVEVSNALINSNIKYNPIVYEIIYNLKTNIPDKPLPLSFCHGDLTFSNMLFKGNNIYVYDFLDSFIDSYIIDIVKLRQDTSIFWSLYIDDEIELYHKTKLKQILNFIDQALDNNFSNDEYYIGWYSYLQKLNLLRVLPYLDNLNEVRYIENQLIKIA